MASNFNYFKNNIERFGDEFLAYKNSTDLKREAPIIFRQIASKKIDLESYGHFFLEKQFLQSCIDVAIEKIRFHGASADGLRFLISASTSNGLYYDPYCDEVLRKHINTCNAYNIVYGYLNQLKMSQDLNYLYAMADTLISNMTLSKSL